MAIEFDFSERVYTLLGLAYFTSQKQSVLEIVDVSAVTQLQLVPALTPFPQIPAAPR